MNVTHPIIFFDGICGLCNTFIDFVMPRDEKRIFKFSPLQGETARKLLPPQDYENVDSVVLYHNGKVYRRSAAVFEIFKLLGGKWKGLSVLGHIPTPITDVFYNLTAKYRYKLFGMKESCRIPTPAERAQFLD